MSRETHPLARQTVTIKPIEGREYQNVVEGAEYRVEDWVENVMGPLQMGNPAVLGYILRTTGLPNDVGTSDLVYGKIGGLGYVLHDSELVRA